MAKLSKRENVEGATAKKAKYISQGDVPKYLLEKAIDVPQAIWDNFAGHSTSPIQVASAMDISPTSSNWLELPGSAVAYGLTTGSYNAQVITVTDLGKRIVAPTIEGDEKNAIVEATLRPRVLKEFYTKYNKAKFPKDTIAINVLIDMGVPQNRAAAVLSIIKDNGKFAGILKEIKGNLYIILDNVSGTNVIDEQTQESESSQDALKNVGADASPHSFNYESKKKGDIVNDTGILQTPKVFISHGKNKIIVEQLKQILKFGQFEVIVSVDNETTAISISEKVFADMRMCKAAIIHVEGEKRLMDKDGQEHITLNQNVLTEIGAAMALYGNNFILLCEKSLSLPSNLSGLYRCEYEGSELNYESTMKLLETFNKFKK